MCQWWALQSVIKYRFTIVNVSYLCYLYFYVYWCPTRFTCQMMFGSFSSNTKGLTIGTGTANPFRTTWVQSQFLVGFVLLDPKFSVQCFVDRGQGFFLSLFFWLLCYLSFLNFPILITPLVSCLSTSSMRLMCLLKTFLLTCSTSCTLFAQPWNRSFYGLPF